MGDHFIVLAPVLVSVAAGQPKWVIWLAYLFTFTRLLGLAYGVDVLWWTLDYPFLLLALAAHEALKEARAKREGKEYKPFPAQAVGSAAAPAN
jgi:hypothetical protein